MMKQIIIYIAISVAISLGIGYGIGHYVALNKSEKDILAIRTILEQEVAEKAAEKRTEKKILEEYLKEEKAMSERWKKTPSKSY